MIKFEGKYFWIKARLLKYMLRRVLIDFMVLKIEILNKKFVDN